MVTQHKQVALVTGANRGLGLAIARGLGKKNFSVWLACRDKAKGEEAMATLKNEGIDAHLLVLDVTDQKSVSEAVTAISAQITVLDVLINNAGINFGPPGTPSNEHIEQIRSMFETNVFGPVLLTQAFLPLLRKSKAARVLMVSSGLGSHALTMDPRSENWSVDFAGYSASKSALNMFALKFAKELLAEGIKVNCMDPGLTATDLGGPFATRTPDEGASIAIKLVSSENPFGPSGGFFYDASLTDDMMHHPW